jgi:16S rRNA (guanine966-N2)-methyltransferase
MRIIGGKYRGKKLISPSSKETRPTSDRMRETIFNILLHNPALGSKVFIDRKVLDVFAGTGALGLEALSRGAHSVIFIENNKEALAILYANIKSFNLSPCCVLEQDGGRLQASSLTPFDLIFLDPPYGLNLVQPTLTQLFSKGLLAEGAVIVIEMGKNDSFSFPSFLTLVTERISGITKVLFVTVSG